MPHIVYHYIHCMPTQDYPLMTFIPTSLLETICRTFNEHITPALEDRYKIVNDPADLFTKDDKPVRNISMLGRPASGKTTFCLHLLKLWCAAINVANKATLSAWHLGIALFQFVFYVSLRHVGRGRSSIVDMICEDCV